MNPARSAERGLQSASTNTSRGITAFKEIRFRASRSGLKPALLAIFLATAGVAQETSTPTAKLRDEWIDADTGHRVVRLSRIPGESESFYFHRGNDWFNHLQFSPTDPTWLQFCHEGPWPLLDRIWHIRTDGSGLRLVHQRTMPMEIAGHEFWSPDGKTAWFDLQMPKGETFFLAGVEVASGQRTRYPIERDQWSVHFNISRDGKLFAGDGGAPNMVARAQNGKWIYLFVPQVNGALKPEKLANMARHDYSLEPNVNFTPDGKWIVFRGNFDGSAQVYAVEVAKAARL